PPGSMTGCQPAAPANPRHDFTRQGREAPMSESDIIGYRTVIVPLDGSPLAELVLPVAIEESKLHGTPLVAMRVVPYMETPPGARSHGPEPISAADLPGEISDACRDAQTYLTDTLTRHGHPEAETVVRLGDPFTQIAAELTRWPRPLIVLASYATAVLPVGHHSELARRIVGLNSVHVLLVPDFTGNHQNSGRR
ncbi:MAG: universal stress protein, partial [Thermomicrobiales bacterium]